MLPECPVISFNVKSLTNILLKLHKHPFYRCSSVTWIKRQQAVLWFRDWFTSGICGYTDITWHKHLEIELQLLLLISTAVDWSNLCSHTLRTACFYAYLEWFHSHQTLRKAWPSSDIKCWLFLAAVQFFMLQIQREEQHGANTPKALGS